MAATVFENDPNGNHERPFVCPLSFWTNHDGFGHPWVKPEVEKRQKFVLPTDKRNGHVEGLSSAIAAGKKSKWEQQKCLKVQEYENGFEDAATKLREA